MSKVIRLEDYRKCETCHTSGDGGLKYVCAGCLEQINMFYEAHTSTHYKPKKTVGWFRRWINGSYSFIAVASFVSALLMGSLTGIFTGSFDRVLVAFLAGFVVIHSALCVFMPIFVYNPELD